MLTGEDDQPLVYPARLCENHHEIAARHLSALSPEQRQPILDELEGRFRAEEKGMKPVYDEISFLHSLCKLMKRGAFEPNLGIKVRDGRIEREKVRLRFKQQQDDSLAESKRREEQRSLESGQQRLVELRKSLHTPARVQTDDESG